MLIALVLLLAIALGAVGLVTAAKVAIVLAVALLVACVVLVGSDW